MASKAFFTLGVLLLTLNAIQCAPLGFIVSLSEAPSSTSQAMSTSWTTPDVSSPRSTIQPTTISSEGLLAGFSLDLAHILASQVVSTTAIPSFTPLQTQNTNSPLTISSGRPVAGPITPMVPGTSTVLELVTITETEQPATVTDTVIVFLPSPTPEAPTSITAWSAPTQMTDLSSFNISAFPGKQKNLDIVQGIPSGASATPSSTMVEFSTPTEAISVAADSVVVTDNTWDNSSSVMQLFYPENSINPAQKPQGGAEFYAQPLDLSNATNITLTYSLFFPADFDWVLGGKLPGLYGGHSGCSGGNDATTCFSTRLMWRKGGVGELYLYAPKDKQTDDLCSDPQSVCHDVYGFSIGRGSFAYAAGAFTKVSQTVVLNTPGKQDGCFALDVNGERVINRSDVFYRDVPRGKVKTTKTKIMTPTPTLKAKHSTTTAKSLPTTTQNHDNQVDDNDGGGGLLGLGMLQAPQQPFPLGARDGLDEANATPTVPTTVGTTSLAYPSTLALADMQSSIGAPVGFTGIFFSTFFGGHEPQYATPKDQYVWFKDFAITINA